MILAIALTAAAACAPAYSLRTAQPQIGLQWPFQPNKAKLIYLNSLTGMARQAGLRSTVRAVVYGKGRQDEDAFVLPVAIAIGSDGRVAVADMGRKCVHLYLPVTQRYLKLLGAKDRPIASPVGLAVDDALRLYVSDSTGVVFAFAPDGSLLYTIGAAGAEKLQRPTGVAYSPTKSLLYVVDTLACKVHAFSDGGKLEFSFGGRGDGPGQFNYPTHIVRSSTGDLLVTDSLNFRIAIFDEQGRPAGAFGHHGDGSGDLAMPKGLAVDADGIVYVVDSLFDNVQLFNRRGEFLLTLGRRGTDFGEFWLPSGIATDANDRLYVCDTYNRRIQVFQITRGYGEGSF